VRTLAIAVVLSVALAGCGRRDDPLPPLIRRADATRDLAAFQQGMEAVLGWSYPSITTDGGPLPDVEAVEVWRATIPAGQEPSGVTRRDLEIRYQLLEAQGVLLATLDPEAIDQATRGPMLTFRDDLIEWRRRFGAEERWVVWYAVRTLCCRDHRSEFSNIARLVPQLPPPPPERPVALPTEVGVTLSWSPQPETTTVVERSEDGENWLVVSPDPVIGASWQDQGVEQGKSWSYRLRAVRTLEDGTQVLGEAGEAAVVDYPDIYPPPAPANLVCLPEPELVKLRWDRVEDAKWYLVSRVASGKRKRLARRLRALQLEDPEPPLGTVSYEVRAVDRGGNASQPAICTTVIGTPP
jgi:hypothetical protein